MSELQAARAPADPCHFFETEKPIQPASDSKNKENIGQPSPCAVGRSGADKASTVFLSVATELLVPFRGYDGMRQTNFSIFPMAIHTDADEWFDVDRPLISTTAQKIRLLIGPSLSSGQPFHLPDMVQRNLLLFLRLGRPDPAFCCFDFISLLYGQYDPSRVNSFDIGHWKIVEFNEEKLDAGDVLTIVADKPSLGDVEQTMRSLGGAWKHSALYLGSKLYLSLLGRKGPLVATTIDQLMQGYASRYALVLKPKS